MLCLIPLGEDHQKLHMWNLLDSLCVLSSLGLFYLESFHHNRDYESFQHVLQVFLVNYHT